MAVPAFGRQVLGPTVESLAATIQLLGSRAHSLTVHHHPDIADLRCMLTTHWYDSTDATHLLFVDADMSWPSALIEQMLLAEKPVVGTVYSTKGPPWAVVGECAGVVSGDITPARTLGTGLMLIRRDVITDLIRHDPSMVSTAPWPIMAAANLKRLLLIFQRILPLSEDLSFCQRCREAGIPLFISTAPGVGHWGVEEHQI